MERYFIELSYVGTAFHGSQLQGNLPTVQKALNDALQILCKQPITTFGASRTDEGVHALQSFYHFDYEQKLPVTFLYSLNALLPHTISVFNIYKVAPDANARFDAVTRSYRYRIYTKKNPFLQDRAYFYPYPFDIRQLNELAAVLLKEREFASFSKRNSQTKTTLCILTECYWENNGAETHFVVTGNRFLRGMVRGLVATQLHLCKVHNTFNLTEILAAKDCTKAFFNVPGHGLYLEKITYPENYLLPI